MRHLKNSTGNWSSRIAGYKVKRPKLRMKRLPQKSRTGNLRRKSHSCRARSAG